MWKHPQKKWEIYAIFALSLLNWWAMDGVIGFIVVWVIFYVGYLLVSNKGNNK